MARANNIIKLLNEMQGKDGEIEGTGGTDICICPECNQEFPHERGTPCNQNKCPDCDVELTGKDTIGSLVSEDKGNEEFKKMKGIINNLFSKNNKYDFEVIEYPKLGSFLIKGDYHTIMDIFKVGIGSTVKLFGDYGYSISKINDGVILKNFSLWSDAAWKRIWK